MEKTRIAIVGAGLAGLHAAWLLEQQGVHDYVPLEARDETGGRIVSLPVPASASLTAGQTAGAFNRFDLGPSWFWPDFQPELGRLVESLGLQSFRQHETGDMVLERTPNGPAQRMAGYVGSPPSMRLVGGMGALTDALRSRLNPSRLVVGQTVLRLRALAGHVELDAEDATGRVTTWQAEHVLLALPPRLAVRSIQFEPALPAELAREWADTATWMAPHAKYLAVFDTPFWREQGLSGEARSARGPMVEIHDASMPGGSAALFGFIGVPARTRQRVPEAELRRLCRAQLVRLFGSQAENPHFDIIRDWAQDPFTATPDDLDADGHHAMAPAVRAATGPWQDRLTGIGSEWSPQFPGYLAGAIEAAGLGVSALALKRSSASAPPTACLPPAAPLHAPVSCP